MKSCASRSLVASLCLVAALWGTARGQNESEDGPEYGGKSLSAWADEVLALNHLANVVRTNHPEVQAVRAIGTNAIPWLLSELRKQPESEKQGNPTNQEEHLTRLHVPLGSESVYHQLRARAGFWALGEMAAPAIPRLMELLEQQPEFVPSAVAGIGVPALPALEQCLTKYGIPEICCVDSAMSDRLRRRPLA